MKYSVEIEINKSIEKIIPLFDSVEHLDKWMEGLKSFEHLSGTPGQVGSKSKLVFQMGRRQISMIETITVKNLPHEFSGTYQADGVFNIVKNKFVKISDNKTKYISEQEFQFKGIFMKLMGFLFPGMFKKQSMKYLTNFKNFVENYKN